MTVAIHEGDSRAMLATLPDASHRCCVTSPPYFGLRDYGNAAQIGLEKTPEAYVAEIVALFREVRRVLTDDGTLWLNLGDSYSRAVEKGGSGPGGKNEKRWAYGAAQSAKTGSSDGVVGRGDRPGSRSGVLGEKQLMGIPWRVAFALQADGWYLRSDIIWSKPNPMPESVTDRPTKAHEYVFLLSRSARYFYDAGAIAEPVTDSTVARITQPTLAAQKGSDRVPGKTNGNMKAVGPRFGDNKYGDDDAPESRTKSGNVYDGNNGQRNARTVWPIATQPFSGAHFATMPPALAERCIKAGSAIGDTVLDPFGGAGTTGLVADRLNRNATLIEVNPEYAALARERITADCPMFTVVA